jgi:pimeloyl-ACP methyl ester carboxylesterase
MGQRLHESLPGPKQFVTIRHAHHNDIIEADPNLFVGSIQKFMAAYCR